MSIFAFLPRPASKKDALKSRRRDERLIDKQFQRVVRDFIRGS